MDVKKVLYISQEIAPYLPATVMSELCRQIPQGIQEQRGFEVRTFMPKYGSINERRNQLHEVIRLSGLSTTPITR
jgi:starch synthase